VSDLGNNLEAPKPEGEVRVQKKAPKGMPARTRIMLEENSEIPPTGLFVGVNGTGYLLKAGEPMDVPASVLEVLDHAIMSQPVMDPSSGQVLGYRERMRYPYRRV